MYEVTEDVTEGPVAKLNMHEWVKKEEEKYARRRWPGNRKVHNTNYRHLGFSIMFFVSYIYILSPYFRHSFIQPDFYRSN